MTLPRIAIVSPYLAEANNGNWRTAQRWRRLIGNTARAIVTAAWPNDDGTAPDLLLALHARRSHASIAAFRAAHPQRPLIVALTGTDVYRDLSLDNADGAATRASLDLADALIVLQEDAIRHVPQAHRRKTHVIHQSAPVLRPAVKPAGRLHCVAVGHLRPEKSPETVFALAERLRPGEHIHLTHIGAPLDDALAARARALAARHPQYRYAGPLPHGLARAQMKHAHLLIHPSIMEGGANVIVEAITAGTPVLASRISGNIGMLGADYPGYFPVGDAAALYALLTECLTRPNLLTQLHTACRARLPLFSPDAERHHLLELLRAMLVE